MPVCREDFRGNWYIFLQIIYFTTEKVDSAYNNIYRSFNIDDIYLIAKLFRILWTVWTIYRIFQIVRHNCKIVRCTNNGKKTSQTSFFIIISDYNYLKYTYYIFIVLNFVYLYTIWDMEQKKKKVWYTTSSSLFYKKEK